MLLCIGLFCYPELLKEIRQVVSWGRFPLLVDEKIVILIKKGQKSKNSFWFNELFY